MKGGCTRHLFRGQNVSGCLSKVSTHQLSKFSFSKSFGIKKKDTSLKHDLGSAQHQLYESLLNKFQGKAVPGSHAWALNAAGLILIGVFERIHQHIIVGVVYAKVPTNGVQEQGTNTMKSKEPPIH